MSDWADATALVVVDLQQTYEDEAIWGPRNNPGCEMNIGSLLEAWRAQQWPIVYVQTDSDSDGSPFHVGTWGHALSTVLSQEPDLLVTKSSLSAFYGEPDLHGWLREGGVKSLAVCGVPINGAVGMTAQMAKELGYEVLVVADATHTFDLKGADGTVVRARDVSRIHSLSLANFGCTLLYTSELVDA